MIRTVKVKHILNLFTIISCLIGSVLSASGTESSMEILPVRPDHYRGMSTAPEAGTAKLINRDPFNWPPDQQTLIGVMDEKNHRDSWSDFNLNGIIFTKRESVAIINGRELKEGERINGATVKSITRDSVRLATPRSVMLLRFPSPAIQLTPRTEAR